jgi:hypothetical protein
VNFSFYPTTEEAEIHLSTMIDNLDLGIIARRIKPETTMGGEACLMAWKNRNIEKKSVLGVGD